MAIQDIHLEEVKTKHALSSFIRFPWDIYKNDRYWVPPLIKDQYSKFSPSNPFLSHAEMVLFLAKKNGQVVGRIAGIIDRHYVEFQRENLGFFGFFESIRDPEVADLLLSKVRDWLRERGMEKMAGPMNPSTNDECGLLIEGFDSSPVLMMTYNPPYYASLLEGWGLRKAMDLFAYFLSESTFCRERMVRITERIMKREPRLHLRPINLRRFDAELTIVKEIYNDAWSKNWGFVPLTDQEIDFMAKALKPLVVADLILFAYLGEEPIGFAVGLPDYNEVLKHLNGKLGPLGLLKFLYYSRKIHTVRVMLLGIRRAFQKKGIETLLYVEALKRGPARGYWQSECSWILENNLPMRQGLEAMGGKRYKTYRIYETPL